MNVGIVRWAVPTLRSTSRNHASGRVILQRGLNSVVPMDCRERKLSGNGVLSGVLCLDKCRSRNANSRELEAYVCTPKESA